jgi:calmodulin
VESEGDLVNAFRAFDKEGNGFVGEAEFSTVMRTFGEPLNDEEVDQLMTAAAPFKDAQGKIQYAGFAKMIHSQG